MAEKLVVTGSIISTKKISESKDWKSSKYLLGLIDESFIDKQSITDKVEENINNFSIDDLLDYVKDN